MAEVDARPGERPRLVEKAAVKTIPVEEIAEVRGEIAEWYDYYTTYVSAPAMAISLETASYVGLIARTARSAVDFGSGFTSYVLRRYCPDVWSVDDDPEWLEKTREFLHGRDFSTDQLVLMEDYPAGQHDLVVYDYAGGEIRDASYRFAFAQVAPGGTIVVDDMQWEQHAEHARAAAEANGMELFSCQTWTQDEFGRWASAATR